MKAVSDSSQGRLRLAVVMALGVGVQACSFLPDKTEGAASAPETPPPAQVVAQPAPEPVQAPPPVAEALAVPEEPVQAEPLPDTTAQQSPLPAAASPVTEAVTTGEDEERLTHQPVQPQDSHTFVVTLGHKDPGHPFYGQGHDMGFFINGEPGKTLILVRGETYHFDVRTDPKHDFYLSTRSDGWGAGVYSHGVKGQFTYRGVVEFTPDAETPDTLYYQCRNHKNMGGKLLVVDPGTDVTALRRRLEEEAAARSQEAQKSVQQADAQAMEQARQKVAYAKLLLRIKGTALAAVDRKRLEDDLARAQSALDAGEGVKALRLAEQTSKAIQAASSGKLSNETRAAYKKEFDELLEGVESFAQVHTQTVQRMQKEKSLVVEYDRMKVDGLVAEAKALAEEDRWQEANDTLRLAQREINSAINGMLHEKTVVYDKNFETPEEEYQYELGRFESYLELIPVAIEQKRPGKGSLSLIERYRDKGVSLRDQAKQRAAKGDYKNAILMLQAATANVRRSLRMAGVSM